MMDEIQYSFSLSQLLQLDSEGEFFTSIEGLINYNYFFIFLSLGAKSSNRYFIPNASDT